MKKIPLLILLLITFGFSACANGSEPSKEGEPLNDGESLKVCSFNIQFLGSSRARDDAALSKILKDYDIVVIQELVAPPYPGTFPDNTPFKPDAESAEFFDEMKSLGFQHVLSEEDTGTGDKNHYNSSATEWWVVFYKPARCFGLFVVKWFRTFLLIS